MAGYIPRRYSRPKTVTHPNTNRAGRELTSFMRRTPLTTTPHRQVHGVQTSSFCLREWRCLVFALHSRSENNPQWRLNGWMQRWTCVSFSSANPTQPTSLQTQPNPTQFRHTSIWAHPTHSTAKQINASVFNSEWHST